MDIEKILKKWYESKKELEDIEKRIKKYRNEINNELNRKETNKLSYGDYTITRRRNTRSYLTKENVPSSIWQQYAVRCSYDSFYLNKKK